MYFWIIFIICRVKFWQNRVLSSSFLFRKSTMHFVVNIFLNSLVFYIKIRVMLQQKKLTSEIFEKILPLILKNLDLFCKINKYKFWYNNFFIK